MYAYPENLGKHIQPLSSRRAAPEGIGMTISEKSYDFICLDHKALWYRRTFLDGYNFKHVLNA